MKILHLISTLDMGGAEQNLLRLVASMDRSCFQNQVVSMTTPGTVGRSLEAAGIPVHSLRMGKGMPDIRGMLRLRFLASLMNPDVIHCWLYHANLLGLSLLNPKRTIWSIRCSDMDLSRYGPVYRWTVKAGGVLSSIPASIVTNSRAGQTVHTGLGYRPRKWTIVPNGFDTDIYAPDRVAGEKVRSGLGIPRDSCVIGLIARLDPMKDHGTFFKAAQLLLDIDPSVHFVLAGKGVSHANPSVRSLIAGNEISDRLHLLEERHDIPQVLNALDIVTSSSISEGLPNAIGEAMCTGIPCVVTDAGDSADLVGETGIVVPKQVPEALCSAWRRLIDAGEEQRKHLGGQARKRIIANYSLESMVQKHESLYRGLVTGRAC